MKSNFNNKLFSKRISGKSIIGGIRQDSESGSSCAQFSWKDDKCTDTKVTSYDDNGEVIKDTGWQETGQ